MLSGVSINFRSFAAVLAYVVLFVVCFLSVANGHRKQTTTTRNAEHGKWKMRLFGSFRQLLNSVKDTHSHKHSAHGSHGFTSSRLDGCFAIDGTAIGSHRIYMPASVAQRERKGAAGGLMCMRRAIHMDRCLVQMCEPIAVVLAGTWKEKQNRVGDTCGVVWCVCANLASVSCVPYFVAWTWRCRWGHGRLYCAVRHNNVWGSPKVVTCTYHILLELIVVNACTVFCVPGKTKAPELAKRTTTSRWAAHCLGTHIHFRWGQRSLSDTRDA